MSWLKLYHHPERLRLCSDKLGVRRYLDEKQLTHLAVPVVAEFESSEQFKLTHLPNQFVVKASHGSSFFHICRDKSASDLVDLRCQMKRWLNSDFSRWFAETNYRGITPRLLVEPYLDEAENMVEFKFLCFHGEPRFVSVITSRQGSKPVRGVYSMDWKRLGFGTRGLINDPREQPCPSAFQELKNYATILCQDFIHVRVDLMLVAGKIYFSELTFYNMGGFGCLEPEIMNEEVGSWIDLDLIGSYE